MALKPGWSVHTWTPTLPDGEGVRTPTGSQPLPNGIQDVAEQRLCMGWDGMTGPSLCGTTPDVDTVSSSS